MGYRQFCRKLMKGRLAVGPCRKRVDVCSVCNKWEKDVYPFCSKEISEAHHQLVASKCPCILADFTFNEDMDKVENPEYTQAFLLHCYKHVQEHKDCPAAGEFDVVES
eukprot:4194928-Prorocentrum_lima.AAC.1